MAQGDSPDGCVLAIDVGGTTTRLGLISREGRIVHRLTYPTRPGTLAGFGSSLIHSIGSFLAAHELPPPTAIGIGMRGIIDLDSERYVSGTLFSRAEEYDLVDALTARFRVPVLLGNDVNAAARAEMLWADHGPCFVYLNIGTGIGAAIVDHGHLLRGRSDRAGEISAYTLANEGDPNTGFVLESIASGRGLEHEIRRLGPNYPRTILQSSVVSTESITSKQLHDAYCSGDQLAVTVVKNAASRLAQVLVNIESITGAGCYVLGGGILSDGMWLVNATRSAVRALCASAGLSWNASIELSSLGTNDVGLLGAAALVFGSLPALSVSIETQKEYNNG